MTLRELENSLPNGFHDSGLKRITVDYEKQTLQLDLSLSVGALEGPREQRDDYREATVSISGLVFCIAQAPDSRCDFDSTGELWIVDGYDTRSTPKLAGQIHLELVKKVPGDAFLHSFFVNDWNAFIHIAARGAHITWKDSGVIKYRGPRQRFLPGDTIGSD